MFTEPLFQSNILSVIMRNLQYYFLYRNWIFIYAGILLFLYGIYFLLKKTSSASIYYKNMLPHESYHFQHSISNYGCFILSLLPICGIMLTIFAGETSLFNNHNLMSSATTGIFSSGVLPNFDLRMVPWAFFEANFIYAITHNYGVISLFILFEFIFLYYLIYKFLDFVPIRRRFIILALCFLLPGMFGLNSIIFVERTLLIFIFISLIFLKKFSRTEKFSSLWFFIFFMNLSIYTKETSILFYLGILATSLLYNIYMENIVIKSFIHPFQTMNKLPVETLMFFSMFLYSILYLFVSQAIIENDYLQMNSSNILHSLDLHRTEIAVTLIGVTVFLIKTFKNRHREPDHNPMLNEGLLLGAVITLFCIVYVFKLTPITAHTGYKSYYAVVPGIFSLVYLSINIRNKYLYGILSAFFFAVFLWTDCNYQKYENGRYYREAAEFLIKQPHDDKAPLNLFIKDYSPFYKYSTRDKNMLIRWLNETWSSALKYYFPEENIVFKSPYYTNGISDMFLLLSYKRNPLFHIIVPQDEPQTGDFLVINKNLDADKELKNINTKKASKVFENKVFVIYKLG